MKVLHLISGRGPTGAAAAAISDVKSLLAAGHAASVASAGGTALALYCEAERIPFQDGFKLGPGPRRLLSAAHDAKLLRRIIQESSIDVLHVHRSDDQLLAGLALGSALTPRLIRSWHREPARLPKPLLSKLATQPDGCVCVARDHAAALRLAGANPAEYIPPGVDTEMFRPVERPETFIVGQVGRWKRDGGGDRGQSAALDIFALLPAELAWKGVLIGRGELEAELRHAAYTKHKLSEERVELRNVTSTSLQQFARMIGSLNLGLIFRPGSDGSSRAAVEMLACGVPILVAAIPGLRELAGDSSCAMTLLSNDPRGWAAEIEKLLRTPECLQAMGRAARARAETVHALPVRGQALAEFYRSCN